MKVLVVTDKNVEKAVEAGLVQLGLSYDEVDIKVVDEGGLFRKAKVELHYNAGENEGGKVAAAANKEAAASDQKPADMKKPEIKAQPKAAEKADKKPQEHAVPKAERAQPVPAKAAPIKPAKQEEFDIADTPLPDRRKSFAGRDRKVFAESRSFGGAKAGGFAGSGKPANKAVESGSQKSGAKAAGRQEGGEVKGDGSPAGGDGGRTAQTAKPKSEGKARVIKENFVPRARETDINAPIDEGIKTCGKEFLDGMFKILNIEAEIDVARTIQGICFNLSGERVGELIGFRGETLNALQYVLSIVIKNKGYREDRIYVNAANYKEKREESLVNLAKKLAEKSRKYNKPVRLEPMSSYERKIIHSALENEEGIVTRSEGYEPMRRLVIIPKQAEEIKE